MKRANEIIEFVHLEKAADRRVEEVTLADRKRIELACALAMRPDLLRWTR